MDVPANVRIYSFITSSCVALLYFTSYTVPYITVPYLSYLDLTFPLPYYPDLQFFCYMDNTFASTPPTLTLSFVFAFVFAFTFLLFFVLPYLACLDLILPSIPLALILTLTLTIAFSFIFLHPVFSYPTLVSLALPCIVSILSGLSLSEISVFSSSFP